MRVSGNSGNEFHDAISNHEAPNSYAPEPSGENVPDSNSFISQKAQRRDHTQSRTAANNHNLRLLSVPPIANTDSGRDRGIATRPSNEHFQGSQVHGGSRKPKRPSLYSAGGDPVYIELGPQPRQRHLSSSARERDVILAKNYAVAKSSKNMKPPLKRLAYQLRRFFSSKAKCKSPGLSPQDITSLPSLSEIPSLPAASHHRANSAQVPTYPE